MKGCDFLLPSGDHDHGAQASYTAQQYGVTYGSDPNDLYERNPDAPGSNAWFDQHIVRPLEELRIANQQGGFQGTLNEIGSDIGAAFNNFWYGRNNPNNPNNTPSQETPKPPAWNPYAGNGNAGNGNAGNGSAGNGAGANYNPGSVSGSDNSAQTPFQDAGFGSEYDSMYNMIQNIAQQNNEWSANQAQLQRDWQQMMSSTAHQREVADLQAAGLNPVLSAGGSGASTPTGAMGQTDTANSRIIGDLALHAIDGLANTAQGAVAFNSRLPENASAWQRISHFYQNDRLGRQLINSGLSALSRLPFALMRFV